ncbi:MAG TPA: permease-like cell division protein FtsX [Rubrobacter sp.]|nr:permease-like cell division protein FtsX [Rubrobacter sp.]
MKSSNWGFFLREAVKNLRLNMLMSFTAITTTAVCVTILGAALLVSAHIQGIIRNVGQDVTISAFFPENASQETIDGILSSVQGYPEVSESTYVSKEEALERWKETFSDQPDIASGIGSDVLPASIELQLNDPRDSGAVAEKLRSEGFEEGDLNYPQRTIDNLNWYTGYMVWALRVATLLFLIASILLISNAIRLSIFARRKEIEVMKLVGASDTFVRTPFVLEGLVQGLLGASLAAVVVVWANSLFVDWAQSYLFSVSSESVNAFGLMLILIAVGVLIGVAGSYFSVRRFLKV